MEQANCPQCLARVMVEFDERCPGCGADLRAVFQQGNASPSTTWSEPASGFEIKSLSSASSNPYQSPRYFDDDKDTFSRPIPKGIAWVLFSFQGRIPRRVYWGASILTTLLFYVGLIAAAVSLGEESDLSGLVGLALYVPYVWVSLAITVKRWHDRDKSGWWILVGIIPIIGPLWQFIETGCLRGTIGRNRYGPDPT